MLINLSDVLSHKGKVIQIEAQLEMEDFKSRLGRFQIKKRDPFLLTLTHVGNREILITGQLDLEIEIPCDRCLESVAEKFHIEISKTLDMNMSEEDRIKELDEKSYVSGYDLDVDQLVYGEILVNWPMKVLCKEECKGICRKCGTNFNEGDCSCDTTVLDPRMAVIRDIFTNSKK